MNRLRRCLPVVLLLAAACKRDVAPTPPAATSPTWPQLRNKVAHYPNGKNKIRWQAKVFEDGREVNHGLYVAWHPNGTPSYRGTWVDGEQHGWSLLWHDDGSPLEAQLWEFGTRKLVVSDPEQFRKIEQAVSTAPADSAANRG